MRKIVLIFVLLAFLSLVVGCREPVYEQIKFVHNNSISFSFNLNESSEEYDITVSVRSKAVSSGKDHVFGELITPLGKTYSDSATLMRSTSTRRTGNSGITILSFKNVKSEDGDFKLFITKDEGHARLNKVTLKVYPVVKED